MHRYSLVDRQHMDSSDNRKNRNKNNNKTNSDKKNNSNQGQENVRNAFRTRAVVTNLPCTSLLLLSAWRMMRT
jgi:hypothetical protein